MIQYPKTLNQFLLNHLKDHTYKLDLVLMLNDLATIGKMISSKTNRAGLTDLLGALGCDNVQGEAVQKLDDYCNELCKSYLSQTGMFAAMASEEDEGITDLGNLGEEANYVIAFDPLDGSSNIDVNVSIGTIFSIHRRLPDLDRTDERQFFQSGRDQVLAGMIVYGTSTQLLFTVGDGVHEFTLDQDIGEFFLSNERVRIPETISYYSLNEINNFKMTEHDQNFLVWLKETHAPKLRNIGSLIADFYRNMIKGGLFMHPAYDDGAGNYKPKLRLNYECKPVAWLAEQAGGAAIDGRQDVLDITPTSLHQRVAFFVGNKSLIESYFNR